MGERSDGVPPVRRRRITRALASWRTLRRQPGFRDGDAGVHALQALVLVNYGGASGHDIANLAQRIQHDIAERFKVELEMEPNQY